jgi:cytidylate kinase
VIVAIDGPAAAGKGTVARDLAAKLGWRYLDTGAMYRAIARAALDRGVSPDDAAGLEDVARSATVDLSDDRVLLDGVDVTGRIRDEDVTRAVSSVAAHEAVRAILVARQRSAIADHGDVVMEGRDIGTTVAPDAEVKVFLTASLHERALRRCLQLAQPRDPATLGGIARELEQRDRADAGRDASPFKKADDAVEIDSTGRSVAEIVDEIAALVARVRGTRGE